MKAETRELITNLVAIIDEELLPNAAHLAIQDFGRLNITLIDARKILAKMSCINCRSTDIQFVSKYSDTKNEYGCIECGRTIITKPENEDKDIAV